MKILGIGIPELMMMGAVIFLGLVVVALLLVTRRSSPAPHPSQNDVANRSAVAYQRLTQLDDLRKRGALTEEEFQQKKQEVIADL